MAEKLILCKACGKEIAKSAKSCPNCGKKNKKPVGLVLLAIVVFFIVIGVITNLGGSDNSSNGKISPASNAKAEIGETPVAPQGNSSAKFTKAGMYKVGSELSAGEYIIEATENHAYYEISSDSSGEFDSIIANDNLSPKGFFAYVVLQDGDYIKITGGRIIDASQLTIQPKDLNNIPPSVYKIGKDLPAGEYKLSPTSAMSYWERSRNPRISFDGIIANDNITADAYVTVRDGEYFKITEAKAQKLD
jgi:hypothetical protein